MLLLRSSSRTLAMVFVPRSVTRPGKRCKTIRFDHLCVVGDVNGERRVEFGIERFARLLC